MNVSVHETWQYQHVSRINHSVKFAPELGMHLTRGTDEGYSVLLDRDRGISENSPILIHCHNVFRILDK
jgi:hypothetical protein